MHLTSYQRDSLQRILAWKRNPAKVGRFRWAYHPLFALGVVAAGVLGYHDAAWGALFLAGIAFAGLYAVASLSRHTYRRWPVQERLYDWDKAKALLSEQNSVQPARSTDTASQTDGRDE